MSTASHSAGRDRRADFVVSQTRRATPTSRPKGTPCATTTGQSHSPPVPTSRRARPRSLRPGQHQRRRPKPTGRRQRDRADHHRADRRDPRRRPLAHEPRRPRRGSRGLCPARMGRSPHGPNRLSPPHCGHVTTPARNPRQPPAQTDRASVQDAPRRPRGHRRHGGRPRPAALTAPGRCRRGRIPRREIRAAIPS